MDIVRQLLRAHEYWRMKQLAVDLVILNERPPSYVQDLQIAHRDRGAEQPVAGPARAGAGESLRAASRSDLGRGAHGCCSRWRGWCCSAVAAALPSSSKRLRGGGPPVRCRPPAARPPTAWRRRHRAGPSWRFFNGLGGFGRDGREYVTILGRGQTTPAPWINVIANPAFGFQVSAEGGGYTWSDNSRENQLTPWSNDPVSDPPGEAIYLRDEESGDVWTPDGAADPRRRPRPMSRATARATAASSMTRTASRSSCCNTCRWRIRSRSRG